MPAAKKKAPKKRVVKKAAKKKAPAKRKPIVITRKRATKSTGKRTKRALAADKDHKALPPGKRLSKKRKVYSEYRNNRTD